MASGIGETISNVNEYLSVDRNFSDVIQLLCLILVGTGLLLPAIILAGPDIILSNIPANSLFIIASSLFHLAVAVFTLSILKIVIYDCLIKKHPFPMLDILAIVKAFGFSLIAYILMVVIVAVAPQVEQESWFGPSTLDFIELLTLFLILGLGSLSAFSKHQLVIYESEPACQHCIHTAVDEAEEEAFEETGSRPIAELSEAEQIEYDDLM